MNNLERKLIELTFPTVDADALLEVITATPNSRVATEILCGVYTEPVFVQDKISSSDVLRTFVSYDKWSEQINYKYQQEEINYCYFPNSVDKATITRDNYTSLKCEYGDDTYRYGVTTGNFNTKHDSCTIRDWERMKDAKFELADIEPTTEQLYATL